MTENKEVQALKAHLALNVHDVEQSIEFYKKLFGIEPSKVRTGYAKFDLHNPPLNLTLNQHQFSTQGALSHLGIQVRTTDDVLAMRQKWSAAGLLPRDEMQTNCCYALQDKTWVRDPDGNEWEVFVVLQDNLAETSACECAVDANESQATIASEVSVQSASCCGDTPVGVTRESKTVEASCC